VLQDYIPQGIENYTMTLMSLDQKDLEILERFIYKSTDDIAVSISRSFERLEERIDASEARTYSRLAEIEDRIEASRQDTSDLLGEVKEEVREGIRMREM
jgi:molybdopterin/thiamine biosynthesis adenylyltransferase